MAEEHNHAQGAHKGPHSGYRGRGGSQGRSGGRGGFKGHGSREGGHEGGFRHNGGGPRRSGGFHRSYDDHRQGQEGEGRQGGYRSDHRQGQGDGYRHDDHRGGFRGNGGNRAGFHKGYGDRDGRSLDNQGGRRYSRQDDRRAGFRGRPSEDRGGRSDRRFGGHGGFRRDSGSGPWHSDHGDRRDRYDDHFNGRGTGEDRGLRRRDHEDGRSRYQGDDRRNGYNHDGGRGGYGRDDRRGGYGHDGRRSGGSGGYRRDRNEGGDRRDRNRPPFRQQGQGRDDCHDGNRPFGRETGRDGSEERRGGWQDRRGGGEGYRGHSGYRHDDRNHSYGGQRDRSQGHDRGNYHRDHTNTYYDKARRNSDGTISYPSQNPYTDRRPGEPKMPKGLDWSMLSKDEKERLRGLSKEHAENIGLHVLAAYALEESDPPAALEHAKWAARQASRIDLARETLALVAYRQGDYKLALKEFRTAYRMNGYTDYLPFIADCERGLGNPRKAIDEATSDEARQLTGESKVEMFLVYAGALGDLGLWDKAIETVDALVHARGLSGDYRMRAVQAEQNFLEEAGRGEESADLEPLLDKLEAEYADQDDEDEEPQEVIIDYDLEHLDDAMLDQLSIPVDAGDDDGDGETGEEHPGDAGVEDPQGDSSESHDGSDGSDDSNGSDDSEGSDDSDGSDGSETSEVTESTQTEQTVDDGPDKLRQTSEGRIQEGPSATGQTAQVPVGEEPADGGEEGRVPDEQSSAKEGPYEEEDSRA